jgi:hypothetical protein
VLCLQEEASECVRAETDEAFLARMLELQNTAPGVGTEPHSGGMWRVGGVILLTLPDTDTHPHSAESWFSFASVWHSALCFVVHACYLRGQPCCHGGLGGWDWRCTGS